MARDKVRKAGDEIKKNKAVLEAVNRADRDIKYNPISKEELNEQFRDGERGSRNIQNMSRDQLHSLGRVEHDLDDKMSKAEFRAAMKSRDLSAQEAYDELDEDQAMNAKLQDFLKEKMVTLRQQEINEDILPEEPDFDQDIEPVEEPTPITYGDVNVEVNKPGLDPIIATTPGVSPNPIQPGVPTPGGGFYVGGDLTQTIGKTGDMITTIGSGNNFGDNVSIGNDHSTTIGINSAGNNNYFGSMLASERMKRAAEGAFSPGVTGLNFS